MSKRLSASRLDDFLGCSHHAALWLAGVQAPEEDNASLQLIRDKGFEHEARVLKRLEAIYGAAVSISDKASLASRVTETLATITDGAALIYQGALANSRWLGFPDFLVRIGRAADGTWTYEPEDAKLARKAKPEHVLQLGIYSELLNEVTACPVAGGAIHVGAGEPERFDLKRTRYSNRGQRQSSARNWVQCHPWSLSRCQTCTGYKARYFRGREPVNEIRVLRPPKLV